MNQLRQQLSQIINDLKSHEGVHLVCDFVGDPVSPATVAQYEAELGGPLNPALKALYLACNGVGICKLPDSRSALVDQR